MSDRTKKTIINMNVGVFCASADDIGEAYFDDALKLGAGIARRSWNLVYGGTNCGLMKKVAEATISNGSKVIGIIPECIRNRGVAATNISELVVAPDMKERKRLMREYSGAFIALPGGWGTLEEITEVITLKQLGCHNKPVVFINTNGFYNKFFDFIRESREHGFISPVYNKLYIVVNDTEEAFDYLENYRIEQIGNKYDLN